MADISDWDPADDANTDAPPHGWPEFMQPSAVNNCARAMMGAIRRWYDTVTAQVAGINASIATKVNKVGDTMSGALTFTPPAGQSANLALNAPASGQANNIYGSIGGSGRWLVQLGAGDTETGGNVGSSFVIHSYADNGSLLGSPISINRQTGAVSLSTGASAAAHATRKDYVDGQDSATYTAAYNNSTAWAAGQDTAVYNSAINHANTIDAAQRTYIDNQDNVLWANIGNRVARGGDTMSGDLTVPNITVGSIADIGSVQIYGLPGGSAPNIRLNGWIYPYADHQLNVGLPGLNADSMHAYAFVVASDARLKADIEEGAGCLPIVQAAPAHTYRLPGAPDPQTRHWGLVAQEVGPALLGGYRIDRASGEAGLAVNELVAVLWGATRELAARVEALEGRR